MRAVCLITHFILEDKINTVQGKSISLVDSKICPSQIQQLEKLARIKIVGIFKVSVRISEIYGEHHRPH